MGETAHRDEKFPNIRPILIFGWGNPSRGDDALGPAFIEHLSLFQEWSHVDLLTDFQLQIEHSIDLIGREKVLFVDAICQKKNPHKFFSIEILYPEHDKSFSSHAMTPQAIMEVYRSIQEEPLPLCQLLTIGGQSFELGAGLSKTARKNLAAALDWAVEWLGRESPPLEKGVRGDFFPGGCFSVNEE